MAVYIVGECGIDYEKIMYVCRSFSTARKRWKEIRKSLILSEREMIQHDKEQGLDWDIPRCQANIDELIKMRPGGPEVVKCDHPFMLKMECEK